VGNTKVPSKRHIAYVLLLRSPQKNPTFSEILFFGINHTVLEIHYLQWSINGKSCAPTGTAGYHKPKKGPIVKAYLIAKS
jgi:hypothetical protein